MSGAGRGRRGAPGGGDDVCWGGSVAGVDGRLDGGVRGFGEEGGGVGLGEGSLDDVKRTGVSLRARGSEGRMDVRR